MLRGRVTGLPLNKRNGKMNTKIIQKIQNTLTMRPPEDISVPESSVYLYSPILGPLTGPRWQALKAAEWTLEQAEVGMRGW